MGRLGGVKIVNMAQALKSIDGFADDIDKKILEAFQYAGESFVRNVRLNREFRDDTGNLQSSIGYVIAKDGKTLFKSIGDLEPDQTGKGKKQGLRLARAVIKENTKGWVLVGVAGMEYGIYVEARGIDVITGSVPGAQELINDIITTLK